MNLCFTICAGTDSGHRFVPFLLNVLTMSHPAATLPGDLEFNCPDKEVIWTLYKFILGCPLPCNVIKDIDPYDSHPENLPGKSHVLF